jgi:DNA helicase HerA-like ATPase
MPVQPTQTADGLADDAVAQPPDDLLDQVQADADRLGAEPMAELPPGAIGRTMFDLPTSQDGTVTVLLPQENAQLAPSQALVRVTSRDGRTYLGIVTAGPFAEPDNLRGDSHLIVTVNTQGGIFLPPFHGRVQIAILGEELGDGTVVPPRLRPLPNSPVFVLNAEDAARVLRTEGDIRLGLVVGHSEVQVKLPSNKKDVLPRHMAILGTTGGGKSTTVAGLVGQAQAAGMAVILLDVEGEYTHLHEPASDEKMLRALKERGLKPAGIPADRMTLYHLVGRETANPAHPRVRPFSPQFAYLSPYAACEILALSEPQQVRFFQAYDVAKEVLRDLGIFPEKGADAEARAKQERLAMELDEFSRGYPRLTLSLLMDVVGACLAVADRPARQGSRPRAQVEASEEPAVDLGSFRPFNKALQKPEGIASLRKRIHAMNVSGNAISWRALMGRLSRLNRLKVFDSPRARPLSYKDMLRSGTVSLVDLSDSGASELNNLVIADLLRGVQLAQDRAYRDYEKAKALGSAAPPPTRVLIIIEEAHTFVSAERVAKMDTLFEQVSNVAKRGRKRWLGLVFVTQLPQHLPSQLFGLVNSFILHKITDPEVANTLQRTVSGIDAGLWKLLPSLAPGQAIVSCPHLARPLLASIDPAPGKLRLVD